jgi:5'-nucleotidase
VGLINNGGIRASLPAGTVTYGMLYEVQPFQNALVRIRLTGAELRRVVEHALRGERPSAHFSGITVRYDLTQTPGQRVRELRRAGGRVIRDRDTVTLATLDFVAGGGSGYTMLTGKPTEVTGLTDVDALILYLRRLPAPVEAPRSGTRLLSAAR